MQTPTAGRIVHVFSCAADTDPRPMTITHVHSPEVVSGVLLDAFANPPARSLTSIARKDSPNTEIHTWPKWDWPVHRA